MPINRFLFGAETNIDFTLSQPGCRFLLLHHFWIKLDEELVKGVMEFALVDPFRQSGEKGFGNGFEELVGESSDEGITVGCIGVYERD